MICILDRNTRRLLLGGHINKKSMMHQTPMPSFCNYITDP